MKKSQSKTITPKILGSAYNRGFKISSKNEKLIKEICRIKNIPLFKAEKSPDRYDFRFMDVDVKG